MRSNHQANSSSVSNPDVTTTPATLPNSSRSLIRRDRRSQSVSVSSTLLTFENIYGVDLGNVGEAGDRRDQCRCRQTSVDVIGDRAAGGDHWYRGPGGQPGREGGEKRDEGRGATVFESCLAPRHRRDQELGAVAAPAAMRCASASHALRWPAASVGVGP